MGRYQYPHREYKIDYIVRTSKRSWKLGMSQSKDLSSRPGLNKAGSIRSGRLRKLDVSIIYSKEEEK